MERKRDGIYWDSLAIDWTWAMKEIEESEMVYRPSG